MTVSWNRLAGMNMYVREGSTNHDIWCLGTVVVVHVSALHSESRVARVCGDDRGSKARGVRAHDACDGGLS